MDPCFEVVYKLAPRAHSKSLQPKAKIKMKVIFFLASLVVYASTSFDFAFLEGEASPVKLKLVDSAGQRLEKLCDHLRRFNAAHLISSGKAW